MSKSSLTINDEFIFSFYKEIIDKNYGDQSIKGKEDKHDILYILDCMENTPTIIRNFLPEKKWEKNQKVWQTLENHQIIFTGNNLEKFK